jgi:prepilin-type N-terminal cleavage/methylation domain-containing protein
MAERRALTLVELLVVIAIIGLLSGLILAASGAVLRLAKKSECQSLLTKVDAAIGQFADRYRSIPVASWGADPANPEPADQWGNRLFRRLGTAMTQGDRTAAETAIPAAVADAQAKVNAPEADLYRGGVAEANWGEWGGQFQSAMIDLIKVVRGEAAATAVLRSHQTAELLTAGNLGKKYLGKVDPTDEEREVIIDPWGQPLIYVSRYAPPVPYRDISTLETWNLGRYQTDKVGLPPAGRATIVDLDGDGSIEDEAAASDIRSHAFPGFELGYELWSAGPDGRFHAIRGHPDNQDNVTVTVFRHDQDS